jgi:Na+/melibiose symporter-like transporter
MATGPTGISTGARTTTLSHLCIAALWFAFFAQWMSIVPLVVPDQISGILGPGAVEREGITGTIVAAGGLVSLVVSPIAGALSDRLRSRRGRRRPFLIVGMLGSAVGLLGLVPFERGSLLWLYALMFMNLQLWWNVGAGPYAGLIADIVPQRDQNMASAWLNIMTIAGTVVGNVLVQQLYRPGAPGAVLSALIAVNLACLVVVLVGVREPPSAGSPKPFDLTAFRRSFWIDPARHQDFYWVLATRLINNLGIWSVLTFMLFYFQTVLAIPNAIGLLPIMLGAGALLAVPASVIGARLATRHGVVRIVSWTSWIMAAAAICYVLVALHPQLWLIVPVGLIFSASYGAYQAVDWALALRVLPSSEDAGKDMGIWHVSMVLPQVIGPAVSGWIISGLTLAVSARFAYLFAFCLAAFWFTLAAWLIRKVRLPAAA